MITPEEVLFEIKFKNLTDIEKQQIRNNIIGYSFDEIILAMERYKVSVEPVIKTEIAEINLDKIKLMEIINEDGRVTQYFDKEWFDNFQGYGEHFLKIYFK